MANPCVARWWTESRAAPSCRSIEQLEFDEAVPVTPAAVPDQGPVANLPVVIMIEQRAACHWPFDPMKVFEVKRLPLHDLLMSGNIVPCRRNVKNPRLDLLESRVRVRQR